jgi:hypothetical protein
MREIDCFTDASYSKEVGGSIIGYKIGNDAIVTEFLFGIKNTEAEIKAIEKCLLKCEESYSDYVIHIYTDCQKALNMQFDNVIFHKMKGHMKKCDKDDKQLIFTQVDKITRYELRQRMKNNKIQK